MSAHCRALLTWFAVYPSIMLIQMITGPHMADWPVPVRTLVYTAFAVPIAVYLLGPASAGSPRASRKCLEIRSHLRRYLDHAPRDDHTPRGQ
jgi:antibiotic biosynthesis monooxygenase (ABM) superfamily enzyme